MVGENDTWYPKTVVATGDILLLGIGSRKCEMADLKHLRGRPIEEKSICYCIF